MCLHCMPPYSSLLQCTGDFVSKTNDYFRATPRYESLMTLLPCDVWTALKGRTLWLVGDSQAQRFYFQLSCFLAPFMEPGPGRQRQHLKFPADPALQKVGGGWPAPRCCRCS